MRTAFVATYDARDVHQWSGLGTFIAQALARNGLELTHVRPREVAPLTVLLLRCKGLAIRRLTGRRYFRGHDAVVARRYARQVDAWLRRHPETELVFSPGTIPIAFVRDPRPLAYWSDATHAAIFDFYAEYSNLCASNRRDGHRIEGRALERSVAALFSSDWAAESARRDYHAPAERVHTVPFGANLDPPPSDETVTAAIERRPTDRCRLLFIGVDWERKGGPFAVEVAGRLNALGLPTELTVVGCEPPGRQPGFVTVAGFISKREPAGVARLQELLCGHHFLIVPSLAECYGLVYCEANAFGLPCLARRVGGVPTIIREGENGWLFAPEQPAGTVAQTVRACFADFGRYRALAGEARRHFKERLNWDVAGSRAAAILRQAVVDHRSSSRD